MIFLQTFIEIKFKTDLSADINSIVQILLLIFISIHILLTEGPISKSFLSSAIFLLTLMLID